MGSWFSNLHIRKNGAVREDAIAACICRAMEEQKFLPASKEEADAAFAIITDERSAWYSVYADTFDFGDPKQFTGWALPLSKVLGTDVLGISCFDSDYLYLNLIDAENQVDAWAGVGRASGVKIGRKTDFSPWENKVSDLKRFKKGIKARYIFAEEALFRIEDCLRLPREYATAEYACLEELLPEGQMTCLYFKLPKEERERELPRFQLFMPSLMPAFLNEISSVSVVNTGGASKGLSVFFIGPYVENEEITFSKVAFVDTTKARPEVVPVELQKVQLADGQWAYYCHDPDFKIPARVDDRLPFQKKLDMEMKRSICIRFTPRGNARKVLDITVVFVPEGNPQGQAGWNVWHSFGSKEAYIRDYNESWSKCRGANVTQLRTEDFD